MAGAFQILKQLKEASDYIANAPQASTAAPKAHGTAAPGVSRSYAREDHVHPKQTTVSTASKLATKRNIALTGAVTGSADFDGSAGISIAATLTGFDASKITSGTIDIGRIPAAALERLVVVADVAALLKLKSTDVQTGDTVQITAASSIDGVSYPAKAMFRVTDGAVFTGSQTEQTVSAALVVYTAGAAASVPWSGVTGKPSTFTPSAHNHSASEITSGTLPVARGGTGRTDGKAASLTTKRTIDGVQFDGSANIHHYGACSTAAGTAAKVVSIPGFVLDTGAEVTVRFTVTNKAANPTLNVNNTGDKAIQYRNAAISAGYLVANRTYRFVYDGSSYELVGDLDTNTKYTAATAAPKAPASSAAVGTSAKYAREDHVHPAQTAFSGELRDVAELHQSLGHVSDTVTVDLSLGNSVSATITGATTLAFTGAASGACRTVLLTLTNGGAYTVTWPPTIKWPGDAAPTLTGSGTDLIILSSSDGGTTWRGVANTGYAG